MIYFQSINEDFNEFSIILNREERILRIFNNFNKFSIILNQEERILGIFEIFLLKNEEKGMRQDH